MGDVRMMDFVAMFCLGVGLPRRLGPPRNDQLGERGVADGAKAASLRGPCFARRGEGLAGRHFMGRSPFLVGDRGFAVLTDFEGRPTRGGTSPSLPRVPLLARRGTGADEAAVGPAGELSVGAGLPRRLAPPRNDQLGVFGWDGACCALAERWAGGGRAC